MPDSYGLVVDNFDGRIIVRASTSTSQVEIEAEVRQTHDIEGATASCSPRCTFRLGPKPS